MFNALFRGSLFTTAAIITVAVVLTFGPRLEERVFPPMIAAIVDVARDGDTLTFWIDGSRPRDCHVVSVGTAWVYGGGLIGPATVYRADRTVVGSAPATPLREGDTFHLGEYTTEAPPQAVALRYLTVLRCWAPWDLVNVETLTLADID